MRDCTDVSAEAPAPRAWGIFRETEHSPGRESDDAEILLATGRKLESEGIEVSYRAPSDMTGSEEDLPLLAFAMCEGLPTLERLRQWEERGVCVINSARAVANAHRERALPLLERQRIPFPESLLWDPREPLPSGSKPRRLFESCWVKQASEHKTREGDVLFAADPAHVAAALRRLADRGSRRAVIQRHVDGDTLKFYGVGPAVSQSGDTGGDGSSWFHWFYPKEHPVSGHAFDPGELAVVACRAARALELEIWGGDAVVTPAGRILIIDINAWPSFALVRDAGSTHIARHVASRLRRFAGVTA